MEDEPDSRTPTIHIKMIDEAQDPLLKLFSHKPNASTKRLEERQLPKSFWIPPREEQTRLPEHFDQEANCGSLTDGGCISHRKSNSSPSAFGINAVYSVEAVDHNRQKSLDTAKTSMDYTKTYQARVRSDHGSQLIRNIPRNTDDPFTLTSPICELPSEYQMAINDENQVYFLNHKTKETTWFDPRIPHEEQKWGMTMKELNDLHISYALRQKRGKHSLEDPSGENQFSSPANDRVRPSITAMNTPISTCQSLEGSNCSPLPNSPSIINSCVRPSSVPRIQNLNTASGVACRQAAGTKTMQTQQMNLLSPQSNQLSVHSRIIHAKSASQPVPMPVSGVGGHADACTGDYLGTGGCGLGIAPSSSMSGLLDQYTHLTPGALTSSSSGHLVQDLEDLSLTASCTGDLHSQSLPAPPPPPPPPPHHHLHSESICGPPDDAHLPHLPQTHPQHQQQQQMFRGASNVLVMNDLAQGSCLSIVAGQHSHQSSMDSGVGQSVVGHSSCGSSQTPEHVKISRYDPNIDNFDMDPELLEGLNYPSDWCHSMNYYMPHQVPSTMATNMELARTQQG